MLNFINFVLPFFKYFYNSDVRLIVVSIIASKILYTFDGMSVHLTRVSLVSRYTNFRQTHIGSGALPSLILDPGLFKII